MQPEPDLLLKSQYLSRRIFVRHFTHLKHLSWRGWKETNKRETHQIYLTVPHRPGFKTFTGHEISTNYDNGIAALLLPSKFLVDSEKVNINRVFEWTGKLHSVTDSESVLRVRLLTDKY